MSARVWFNQRAQRDLVPVERDAIRAREARIPVQARVKVFESSKVPGMWTANVHGRVLPHVYPTAYDAACAALGRLETDS